VILHLDGGVRDGETLDLDEPRWCVLGESITAGVLPRRLTIDPYVDSVCSYNLIRAEDGEGWYQLDAARTAQIRVQMEHDRLQRQAAQQRADERKTGRL